MLTPDVEYDRKGAGESSANIRQEERGKNKKIEERATQILRHSFDLLSIPSRVAACVAAG